MKKIVPLIATCAATVFLMSTAQASTLGMPQYMPNTIQLQCTGSSCHALNFKPAPGLALMVNANPVNLSGSYTMTNKAGGFGWAPTLNRTITGIEYFYENEQGNLLTVALVSESSVLGLYQGGGEPTWTQRGLSYHCNQPLATECPYTISAR